MPVVISAFSATSRHELGPLQALAADAGFELDLATEVSKSYSRLWTAELDGHGRVAGMLLSWDVADEQQLVYLATSPEVRRRGIGRALMYEMIEHARRRGARSVLLEVRASNRSAITLYQALSFSVFRVRSRYYTEPVEDAVEMELRL